MRISGVTVGKVKKIELGDDGRSERRSSSTQKYAPLPSDSRGDPAAEDAARRDLRRDDAGHERRADAARRAPARHEQRRARPSSWTRSSARSTRRRARRSRSGSRRSRRESTGAPADFSDALGSFEPFAVGHEQGAGDPQRRSSRRSSSSSANTGEFFEALTERDGQLAEPDHELQPRLQHDGRSATSEIKETFIALPTFIDESKKTLRRLESYAANTNPLVTELHPWAREASNTLQSARRPRARLQPLHAGARARGHGVRRRASRPASSSSTTCGRCWASSTRSCATSTRSCAGSASTTGSSRPSSPTSPRRSATTTSRATTCAHCA